MTSTARIDPKCYMKVVRTCILPKIAFSISTLAGILVTACALISLFLHLNQGYSILILTGVTAVIVTIRKAPSLKLVESLAESRAVWIIASALGFALMSYIAIRIQPQPTWDWGILVDSAFRYASEHVVSNPEYYAQYPNNEFWFSCLTQFFNLCLLVYPSATRQWAFAASAILSCACLTAAISVIRLSAGLLLESKRRAFLVWCACYAFVPFWLYSPFAYNDTPGVLLCALAVLLYEKARLSHSTHARLMWCCALGIVLGIAWRTKVMLMILAIAMLIASILSSNNIKSTARALLCVIAAMIAALLLSSAFCSSIITISNEDRNRYEFPPIHWVMMSLDYGGYVQEDVDFTRSFDSYDKKRAADTEELKARIEKRGLVGTAYFLMITKAIRTWGDSTLAGSDYIDRKPTFPESMLCRVLCKTGDYYAVTSLFTWIYHIVLLIGIPLGAILALRSVSYRALHLHVSFIGVYLFFSIWECNPRYLLCFAPMLILCSSHAWLQLRDLSSQ